jgi:phage/plasmid-associated DNA primase
LAWVEDGDVKLVLDGSVYTEKDDVYRSYSDWCKRNGCHPLKSAIMWKRTKQKLGDYKEVQKGYDKKRHVPIEIRDAII